jgi:hypothetical protein
MISKILEIELKDYLEARYKKCKDSVQYLCGNNQDARNLLDLLWEIEFLRNKVEVTEVNKSLINALETWEELFLKMGESEIVKDNISIPDYSYTYYIEVCLKIGRKALEEAKNGNGS